MFRKIVVLAYLYGLVTLVHCIPPIIDVRIAGANQKPLHSGESSYIAIIGCKSALGVRWLCGGSLIWENFILTAAHCASIQNNIPNLVRMGGTSLDSIDDEDFVQQFDIVNILRHPEHKFNSKYFDIALMKLDRKVTINDYVVPVCLWVDDEIRFPQLFVAGWGGTGIGESMSETLLQGSIVPISNHECSRHYSKGERELPKGLMDHQMCAGENETDTCPGDSGGPLHTKLVKGGKFIPFLVGVTSFGKPCGLGTPGVYVKVSKFIGWIVETLKHYGEKVSRYIYEPMVCADRYYDKRTYVSDKHKAQFAKQINSENSIVFRWQKIKSHVNTCSGTLIKPYTVVTLAECVYYEEMRPTQVELMNGDVIDIVESNVHPLYNPSIKPNYNNIAVVKLKSPALVKMDAVWLGNLNLKEELIISGQSVTPQSNVPDHFQGTQIRAFEYSPEQCRLRGTQSEHFCFMGNHILVPDEFKLMKGSPIYRLYDGRLYVEGIALFGRDFWLKEPAVGVRLSAHIEWLSTVLITHPKPENENVELVDQCEYPNQTKGICVPETKCPVNHGRLQISSSCPNSSFVCCPSEARQMSVILSKCRTCLLLMDLLRLFRI